MPPMPDYDGTGEFAIGFDPPAGETVAARSANVDAIIADVKDSVRTVTNLGFQRIDACLSECRGAAEQCAACLTGGIDRVIDDVAELRNKVAVRAIGSIDQWGSLAASSLGLVLTAHDLINGSPAAVQGSTAATDPELPSAPPPASSLPPVAAHPILSGPITVGETAPLLPPQPAVPLPPTTAPTGPTKSTIPNCVQHQPGVWTCTMPACAASCSANGGVFAWDDYLKGWKCTFADGTATFCQTETGGYCFGSDSQCAAFVAHYANLGWTLIHPDPDRPETIAAHNTNTGETIYCGGYGPGCTNALETGPADPLPPVPYMNQFAFRVIREDNMATWIDQYGKTYGPLRDLSACPFTNPPYAFFPGSIWVRFQDGKAGWLISGQTDPITICADTTTEPPPEPTIDNWEEWVADQEVPEDWDILYDTDTGEFVLYNSETEETQMLGGQTPEPPAGPDIDVTPDEDEFSWDEENGVVFED